MDDLVAWLRAQLDEDEAMARDADLGEAEWYSVSDLERGHHEGGAGLNDFDARFLVRHSPARVLREVEAKRRIIELYEYAAAAWELDRMKLDPPTVHLGEKTMAQAAIQALAYGSYADRPGYREEWRP